MGIMGLSTCFLRWGELISSTSLRIPPPLPKKPLPFFGQWMCTYVLIELLQEIVNFEEKLGRNLREKRKVQYHFIIIVQRFLQGFLLAMLE